MKWTKYLVLSFFLVGCSSLPNKSSFKSEMNDWIMMNERTLIMNYGYPYSIYSISQDEKILTYVFNSKKISQSYYNQYIQTITSQSFESSCNVKFVVLKGIIQNWEAEGRCYK